MQGKFSDSPYFMISDFFDEIKKTKHIDLPILSYKWDVLFVSTFVDNTSASYIDGFWTFDDDTGDDVVFTNFEINVFNIDYSYNPNEIRTDNSYIVSPFVNINANGNGIVHFYVKEPNVGYIPIYVKYLSTEDDRFNFTAHDAGHSIKPGDTIVASLSGTYYEFDEYNTSLNAGFNGAFNNNRETYWRKDSLFHDWLKTMAHDYYEDKWGIDIDIRNYIDYDNIFLLFHRIFKDDNDYDCRIIFYGMKNFIMNAVPEHQRTIKFKEFMDIFFDELYQEEYNQLKDVWDLIDAMNTSIEYLGYLSKFYDMFDVEIFNIPELQKREFVRDMIWILKRKGTYTDFFILWRILTNTKNRLNLYERWHIKDVASWPNWPSSINPADINTWPNYPYYSNTNQTTNVPADEWYDVIYTTKPEYHQPPISGGAGLMYYTQNTYPCTVDNYDTCGKLLSTHYIVEIDLSTESLDNDKVLSKETWENISSYWEYLRPVNRVSHYRIVLAPKTNFSNKFVSLYEGVAGKTAFVLSKNEYYYSLVVGGYIHKQNTISNEWIIHHNLGGHLHIQTFDDIFNEIIPSSIIFDSTSVCRVLFNEPITGFALLKIADESKTQQPINNLWDITNNLNNQKLIINFNEDDEKEYEGDLELVSNISSLANFSTGTTITRRDVLSEGNVVFFQNTPATEWNVVHNLGTNGVIANVYDTNNKRINPSEFILGDPDVMKLEFDHPQDGYIVLLRIGNFNLDNFNFGNVTIKLFRYIGDMDNGEQPVYESNADYIIERPEAYYIQRIVPQEESFIFNEIAIYHENGNLLFYTKCSDTYNPPDVMFTLHYHIEKTT